MRSFQSKAIDICQIISVIIYKEAQGLYSKQLSEILGDYEGRGTQVAFGEISSNQHSSVLFDSGTNIC